MPDYVPGGTRVSRETRLLVVTITVSALVLLLLARLRFPEPPAPIAQAAATPLERLAARASYDELAASVSRFESAIGPSLIVLRLAPRLDTTPRALADLLAPPQSDSGAVRHVPALRISGTTALAAIDPDTRIAGIVGETEPSATAGIIASDPIRRFALVRVPQAPARVLPQLPLADLRTPLYVVAVEGTHAGVTLRPVFLGRGDRFGHPRWSRPLLPIGGTPVRPGTLMFSLQGQFIGCVVLEDSALSIAGAQDVTDTINRLASQSAARPADAGITVQPLTPALAAATGAAAGVVVAEVREDGPADGVLNVGDVITAFNGETVDVADRLILQIARSARDSDATVTIWRDGEERDVQLTLAAAATFPPLPEGVPLQMRLQFGDGAAVTFVAAGSAAAAAGLTVGDVIVRAGGVHTPTPAEVRQVLARAADGSYVMLVIRREGRQRLLAIQPSPPSEAANAAR